MNIALLRILVIGSTLLLPARGRAFDDRPVSFNRDVRPILSNNCFQCHGPDESQRKADLRLDTDEGLFADLDGRAPVVRGKPAASELLRRVSSTEASEQMPPRKTGKKLTPAEIATLKRWIEQGAPSALHWSYSKPVRAPLPVVKQANWPKNPVDRFIQARLEREGLAPAPEADRYTLVRRVTLDLTGLPPTWQEVEAFVHDARADAYERLVDRLLAQSAYGEHWAYLWLDLARYADSAGYADDPLRTIWLFRDYVIKSLNANKPFDQFTVEQIAGDLLSNPTDDQLIATAFHRNTLTNNEGGTVDEEFRNVAVVDRVNTTMAVWMGTTIACAQCHNHKYDPISQEEYFRFFAFFNNTEDADRTDEAPVLARFTKEEESRRKKLEQDIAGVEAESKEIKSPDPKLDALKKKLAALNKELKDVKGLTVPIMRELKGDKRRTTKIQFRGNYLDLGKEVAVGVPAAFPSLPNGAAPDRLLLAKWLIAPENPLTARVIANRYWEQLMGVGIVATSEEFGAQGDLPVHPELLDWLATELVRQHWDLKAFLKLLVTSAAYRQSSRVTAELQARDPDNRLLARGPRFRLSAEMVRDQALRVSGLLSGKMLGPPVRPLQPAIGLNAAFGSGIDWKTSPGEDQHRRALYTMWRRSNPYPSMAAFDAPNREVCTVRRGRTNTPLQALVTLNDPVYVEAAQALARRAVREGGNDIRDRIEFLFHVCLSRPAEEAERERTIKLYQQALDRLRDHPKEASKLATDPLGPLSNEMDAVDLAAWTVVANVMLNLDETLMKR
jgi:Protein of unknown function (DUF1553)/Protein of unknown function (DUF1549)/Planctomycete cytochrome C